MPDLEKLSDDLFDDPEQSHAALFAGFLDHDDKFQSATDLPTTGAYGTLVTEARAETAALAIEARAAQEALDVAEREQSGTSDEAADGRTVAEAALSRVNSLIDGVITDAKVRDRVRAKLFPKGLVQYTRAKIGDFPTMLAGFLTTLTENKAAFGDLGDALVTSTSEAFDAFKEGRGEHTDDQTDTGKARTARKSLRPRLTNQLTNNHHLLCLCYATNRKQVLNYFTKRYFERQRVSNPAGERRRTVQANQAQVLVDLETYVDPTRYQAVQVRLKEGGPARFFRTDDPRLSAPADALLIPAGDALHKFALADVPGTGSKLVLVNDSGRVLHVELALLEG